MPIPVNLLCPTKAIFLGVTRRTGSSDAKGNKHIEHPGDVAGGGGGAAGAGGKTLDRIVNAKEEVSEREIVLPVGGHPFMTSARRGGGG